MNIMLNGEVVEELSTIVHASKAREYGKRICTRLKESIPKQLFQVAIQATVGGKILARENISALRKDVTAKCVSSVSDSLLIQILISISNMLLIFKQHLTHLVANIIICETKALMVNRFYYCFP